MSDRINKKFFWFLGEDTAEKHKMGNVQLYRCEMALRSLQIFEYTGLPDTIPKWALESILMTTGRACITEYENELYCYDGEFGGDPDVYYRPTRFVISNPYQNFCKNVHIGTDGVLVENDDFCMGLYPIWDRSARAITETDISIRLASILSRMQSIISATDDRTKASADEYINKVLNGEISVVMDDGLIESLHVSPYSQSGSNNLLTQLMELRTYQLNTFFNEIGIQASVNQKRENVSELEASQNADYLLPLVDNMLECRKRGMDEVNKMYGTNISVEFSPLWKKMRSSVEAKEPTEPEKTEEPTEPENTKEPTEGGEENVQQEEN